MGRCAGCLAPVQQRAYVLCAAVNDAARVPSTGRFALSCWADCLMPKNAPSNAPACQLSILLDCVEALTYPLWLCAMLCRPARGQ